MENDDGLYQKHRPARFSDLVGQPEAVAQLAAMGKAKQFPHALLLTGPSGCGKTTIARILRGLLKCGPSDFKDYNAASTRGIDTIREIDSQKGLAPMAGECRIWLVDECHKLTDDAQSALLKMLEDTPRHVYFMLATTDPRKLKKTIITRCTEVKLREIGLTDLARLVTDVAAKEGKPVSQAIAVKIAATAEGSGRKALVILQQIINLTDDDAKFKAIEKGSGETEGIEIARALLAKKPWKEVAALLKECDVEAETVRRIVIGYMSSVLLGGGTNDRAFRIMNIFRAPFYDTGKPGLVEACYEVATGK